MIGVQYKMSFLAGVIKRVVLLAYLSIFFPREVGAESIDLELIPGTGVVGYMEFDMSAKDIIALARHVNVEERNSYYYHTGTKKVEMASSIEIEDIGVSTTFSFFEDSRGLVRQVLSLDVDLRKGARRGSLVLNLMARGCLPLKMTLTKEQVAEFMSNSGQAEFRHHVYGSNNEFESLNFDKEGLIFCFSGNRLTNIRMQKKEGAEARKLGSGLHIEH
jgi:hypothetical protein